MGGYLKMIGLHSYFTSANEMIFRTLAVINQYGLKDAEDAEDAEDAAKALALKSESLPGG